MSPENHTFVYEDLPQIGIAEPLSEYSKNVILGNHNAGRRIVRPSGADMREQVRVPTVTIFNSCTKCVVSPGIVHACMSDCHAVS